MPTCSKGSWVPVSSECAIDPKFTRGHNALELMGVLGSHDWEYVAMTMCVESRAAEKWMGALFVDRSQPGEDYYEMVQRGILFETETPLGWLYGLTTFAIERIYLVQSQERIRYLEGCIRDQEQAKARKAAQLPRFVRFLVTFFKNRLKATTRMSQ